MISKHKEENATKLFHVESMDHYLPEEYNVINQFNIDEIFKKYHFDWVGMIVEEVYEEVSALGIDENVSLYYDFDTLVYINRLE